MAKVTEWAIEKYANGKSWKPRGSYDTARVYVGDIYYDVKKGVWMSQKLTQSQIDAQVAEIEKLIADGEAAKEAARLDAARLKEEAAQRGEKFYEEVKNSARWAELQKFPKSLFTWSVTKLDGGFVFVTARRESTELPCQEAEALTENDYLQGCLTKGIQMSSLRMDSLDSKNATVHKWLVNPRGTYPYIDDLKRIIAEMYALILETSGMTGVQINFDDCE